MMATIMFVMVPRAAVSAGRIREVLDTEPTIRDPVAPGAPTAHAATSSSATSSSATRAPRSRCCAASRSRPTRRDDGDRRQHRQRQVDARSTSCRGFYDVTGGAVLRGRRRRARDGPRSDLWAASAWSPSRPSCSAARSPATCATATRTPPTRSCGTRSRSPRRRDFVAEMPEGLEAPITQGGTNVSGGQRQRLAIARALVQAAGHLHLRRQLLRARLPDRRAPARRARRASSADATVIIVAQRVGTILHADRIVVLEDGRGRRHRHPRRADADLRDIPRDRPLPGDRGGGRVSAAAMGRPAAGGPTWRPARLGPGVRPMGMSCPPRSRRTSAARSGGCSRAAARSDCSILRSSVLGVVSVAFAIVGPKILGNATNILFEGVRRQAAGRPGLTAFRWTRSSPGCAPRARPTSPTCSRA